MNGKKARKLRKQLEITKENLRNPDYKTIEVKEKIVFFRDKLGRLVLPKTVKRYLTTNETKKNYKQLKKQVVKG